MFLQAKMGNIISHGPVGFKISGKFKRFTVFIQLALRRSSFLPFFCQFIFAERMTGRLYQAGIDSDALVDG